MPCKNQYILASPPPPPPPPNIYSICISAVIENHWKFVFPTAAFLTVWSSVDLGTVFPLKSTVFSPSSLLSHSCRSLSSCCLSFIVLSIEMAMLLNCFQSFRFLAFLRTFIFESASLRVTLIGNRDLLSTCRLQSNRPPCLHEKSNLQMMQRKIRCLFSTGSNTDKLRGKLVETSGMELSSF